MRNKLLLITLLLLPSSLYAKPQFHAEKNISIDSGYFLEDFQTNRSIAHFGLENLQALSVIMDKVPETLGMKKNPLLLSLWSLTTLGAWYYSNYWNVWLLAYHEFGHGTRVKALGGKPAYCKTLSGCSVDEYEENFFLYYLSLFPKSGSEGGIASSIGNDFPIELKSVEYQSTTSMGGLNNEMFFTEYLAQETFKNGGNPFWLITYINAKLSLKKYVSSEQNNIFSENELKGDITQINEHYKTKDFTVSYQELETASYISLLGSGTMYSLLWGLGKFMYSGDSYSEAITLGNIALPEICAYLNSNGLSYSVSSMYKISPFMQILWGGEAITQGNSQYEIHLGSRYRTKNWDFLGKIFLGKSISATSSVEYRDFKPIKIEAGISHYSAKNLVGERHIRSYKEGLSSQDIWARIGFTY